MSERSEKSRGDSRPPSVSTPTAGPDLHKMANEMFDKTSQYLQGQLEGTGDEYKLLEDMNNVTAQKYSDMKQVTQNVARALQELNEKYANLQPYLEQIDEIDKSSRRLEEAAYALDAYVKSLDSRFKKLEKRGSV